MNGIASARKSIADAIQATSNDLAAIREQVERLRRERDQVAKARDDFATIEMEIDGAISEAAHTPLIGSTVLEAMPRTASALNAGLIASFAKSPFYVLAQVAPEALREALLRPVEREGGISPDMRAAELARIDKALLAAEITEELNLRQIDAVTSGYTPRRADADPAILLAPDDELEAPPG